MPPTASLNPASVPFFPGTTQRNGHSSDDERGISPAPGISASGQSLSLHQQQQQQQRLTPSPMPMAAEMSSGSGPIATGQGPIRFQQSPPQAEWMRASPLSRSMDSDKAVYSFMPPPHETRLPLNLSSSSLSQSPPLDDFQSIDSVPISSSASSSASLAGPFRQNSAGTHAMAIGITQNGPRGSLANIHGGNTGIGNNSPNPLISAGISASPVSSLGSSSHFTTALEYVPPPSAASASSTSAASLDAQLRTSPVIRDIFDRLARCENVTRRISEELFEVHRKVDVLVDRALNPPLTAVAEDFKDPFAPPGASGTISARPSVSGGLGGPGMNGGGDDITQISQRLNTLTSSVGQLLAIQTQQLGANVGPRHGTATPPLDLAPNQLPGPHLSHSRPSISRGLNPPMRTWSAGSLDLPPMRGQDMPQMPRGSDLLRADKGRRSVSNVLRRDSAGDAMMGRDGAGGPTIGKWEQLNLAPELLRSLTKFGVGPPNKIQQRALPFLLRGSDIIAQAPPTQERIAAYVIPAIHVALVHAPSVPRPAPGPAVVMVSTTVDQATQAQRMIRDLGGPIGIRSGLGVGAGTEVAQELRLLQQSMPHILCGTPQKLHALFTAPGAISGAHVRLLVLDEVDQLIARNLHEFLFGIVKLLPSPRSSSPSPNQAAETVDRQTALFSNTVPQDVLNLATAIQLREPVRVLVRRDGNVTHTDTAQSARGLRQFYLYLAFTAGGARDRDAGGAGLGIIGSGRGGAGTTSAESVQAREWKLDALADLFEDVDVGSAIVHVGGMASLDAVAYKLASRGLVAVPLHSDMNASVKMAALNKFRTGGRQQGGTRVLVVYDVQVKSPEVAHVPLVINYDLPKAVEEYAHRVASAIAPPGSSRAGVVVNFVTATGGDVEMLRSIECFYKIKCPEVPMSLRDVF